MAHRAAGRGSGDGIDRNTGSLFGKRWSDFGRRCVRVGKVQAGWRGPYIWHKPCPIAGGAGARQIFETPNVGEAARIPGASLELRARCRTAPVANTNPHKVSTDA